MTTIAIMLWNIMGWLGLGLVLNHSHEHGEANHCEVTFCYCEIEDGQSICTCHHNDMKGTAHHSGDADHEQTLITHLEKADPQKKLF